jgi:low temperature requirement protein LtrA
LVFVFAITQITAVIAGDLTAFGLAKGLLLLWLAWWQWTAFTWLGAAVDLQAHAKTRIMVLSMIPAVLLVAVALPAAYTSEPYWFAGAYFVVQALVLMTQGVAMSKNEVSFRAWRRYAPFALLAPMVMVVGANLAMPARFWVWSATGVMFVISAIFGGASGGEWTLSPTHFAERHALFVIIVLGEIMVAIGANATSTMSSDGLPYVTVAAVTAAAAVACALWWSYFGYVPQVFEHAIASAAPTERGTVARDVGSFNHFPLICGAIAFAVLAEHTIAHPLDHSSGKDQLLLGLSGTLWNLGFLANEWRLKRAKSLHRWAAVGATWGLAAIAPLIPRIWVVVGYAIVVGASAGVSWHKAKNSDAGRALGL